MKMELTHEIPTTYEESIEYLVFHLALQGLSKKDIKKLIRRVKGYRDKRFEASFWTNQKYLLKYHQGNIQHVVTIEAILKNQQTWLIGFNEKNKSK